MMMMMIDVTTTSNRDSSRYQQLNVLSEAGNRYFLIFCKPYNYNGNFNQAIDLRFKKTLKVLMVFIACILGIGVYFPGDKYW